MNDRIAVSYWTCIACHWTFLTMVLAVVKPDVAWLFLPYAAFAALAAASIHAI